MPPKKRARVSAASTPLAESQPKTPVETPVDTTASGKDQSAEQISEELLNDPWTDEQESQLFKSLIRWKPTGMHKHFRMISISQHMRSNGYSTDDPSSNHTRTTGIWAKLRQLYDLDALDERENHHLFALEPDPHDPNDIEDMPEFQLPEDEFGDLMWMQRFANEEEAGNESPPLLPELLLSKEDPPPISLGRSFTIPDPDKDEIGTQSSPPTKGRATTKAQSRTTVRTGRAARAPVRGSSKAQSTVSESDEEEEEEEGEEEEEEEEESEDELAQQRTTRVSSRRKSARGKRGR